MVQSFFTEISNKNLGYVVINNERAWFANDLHEIFEYKFEQDELGKFINLVLASEEIENVSTYTIEDNVSIILSIGESNHSYETESKILKNLIKKAKLDCDSKIIHNIVSSHTDKVHLPNLTPKPSIHKKSISVSKRSFNINLKSLIVSNVITMLVIAVIFSQVLIIPSSVIETEIKYRPTTYLEDALSLKEPNAALTLKELQARQQINKDVLPLLQKAEASYMEANYRSALSYVSTLVTENPNDNKLLELKGDLLFLSEDYDLAIAEYERIKDENSKNIHLLSNLALSYYVVKDYDSAREYYEQVFELDSEFLPALSNAAFLYAILGENEKSEELFQKIQTIDKDYVPFLNNYALYNALTGNIEKSSELFSSLSNSEHFDEEFQNNKEWVESQEVLGELEEFSDVKTALDAKFVDFEHSVAFVDNHGSIYNIKRNISYDGDFKDESHVLQLSNRMLDNGEYNLAEWYYLYILERNPKNVKAVIGLGNAYVATNLFEEASVRYRMALSMEPGNIHAIIGQGNVLLGLGNFNSAITQYNKALEEDSGNPNAVIGLGNTHLAKGNPALAIEYYDIILETDAYSDHINANKAKARALYLMNHLEESEEYFTKVLNLTNGEDRDALYGIGLVLLEKGLEDEANKYFARADTKTKDVATLLSQEAKGYMEYNIEIAETLITQAIQLDPDNPKIKNLYDEILSKDN